jgi:hypothetical protein
MGQVLDKERLARSEQSGSQDTHESNRVSEADSAPLPGQRGAMTKATPAVVAASKLGLTFQTNDGPVRALSDVDLTIG